MKEETVDLSDVIKNIPLEKICSCIPLKILNIQNYIIWENDLSKGASLDIYPLNLSNGIEFGSIKTTEAYKGILRKIIFKEIDGYFKEERKVNEDIEFDLLMEDFSTICSTNSFEDNSFSEKNIEESVFEVLRMFRKYFPAAVINIFVKDDSKKLKEFCEISSEGIKAAGDYWDFSFREISELSYNTKSLYYSEKALEDPYFGEKLKCLKDNSISNFLTAPLIYFGKNLGSINFYNFVGGPPRLQDNWRFKNFIQLISYKLFLIKFGEDVFERKYSEKILKSFRGSYVPDYKILKKEVKNIDFNSQRDILVMYGKIDFFWENFDNVQIKTQGKLLHHYFITVSSIVNSFEGHLQQIDNESFLVMWNYPKKVEEFEQKAVLAAINLLQIGHDHLHVHWKSFGIEKFGLSLGLTKDEVSLSEVKIHGKSKTIFHSNFVDTAKQLQQLAPSWTAYFHEKIINDLSKSDIVPMRKFFNLNLKGDAQSARVFSFKI
jgi:hypothetical protein